MKRSNTHRKAILLYCSQATQTQDDSEAELDSDFPPCVEGNHPPLISCHSPEPQLWRRRQPKKGLGQTNVVNTVDAHTKVVSKFVYSLLHMAMLTANVNISAILLLRENIC